MTYPTRLGLVLVALLLSACGLNSRSPEPEYHVLNARAEAIRYPLRGTIGVGPVRVAPFLLNDRISTHAGGSQLRMRDGQRWGEPLDQGIQRVVLQNLATLTDTKMRNFPWRQRAIPQHAVRLDILDLDRLADGTAKLEAIWIVEDVKGGHLARSLRETFTTATRDASPAALTDAYSELLLQLAERVAKALTAEKEALTAVQP